MTADTGDHAVRVLLVINQFSSPGDGVLDGLTKLAKLDFLLRYPAFLAALTRRIGVEDPAWEPVREVERLAVTNPMVRYKYGPWDDRYYVLIGNLVGRGLVEYAEGRGRVALRVTPRGRNIADQIRGMPEWSGLSKRIGFLRRNFDLPGNQLKSLIYDTFPSLVAQPFRAEISASPLEAEE